MKFIQTKAKLEELQKIQDRITLYNAELSYKIRELSGFQKIIAKERSRNTIRDSWKLIKSEYPLDLIEFSSALP